MQGFSAWLFPGKDGLLSGHLSFLLLNHFLDHIAAYGAILVRSEVAVVTAL